MLAVVSPSAMLGARASMELWVTGCAAAPKILATNNLVILNRRPSMFFVLADDGAAADFIVIRLLHSWATSAMTRDDCIIVADTMIGWAIGGASLSLSPRRPSIGR